MDGAPVAVMDGVPFYGEPASLSPTARVESLIDLERQIARLQARQLETIAAMDHAGSGPDDREWVTEELRAALGDSAVTAHARLEVARELTGRLRATLRALKGGSITHRMAEYLVERVAPVDQATAHAIEAHVLAGVRGGQCHTAAEFQRRVRRALLAHDARATEQRREQAIAQRRVMFSPQEDGVTELWALLPSEAAARLKARLNAAVDRNDPRTADQQRADALCEIPGAPGPAVSVVVPVSTLLGGDTPGELNGEPIPATLARMLAHDPSGTWRRLLTDPAGALQDYGRTTYRPPAGLDRFVRLRDRTCRFPGCHRTAAACEIDHVLPWAQGGRTDADNLICLCPRHHHLKHDARWKIHRSRDGTVTWTSPAGHIVVATPATYPTGEDATVNDPRVSEQPLTNSAMDMRVERLDPAADCHGGQGLQRPGFDARRGRGRGTGDASAGLAGASIPQGRRGFQAISPGRMPGAHGTIGWYSGGREGVRTFTERPGPRVFVLNAALEQPLLVALLNAWAGPDMSAAEALVNIELLADTTRELLCEGHVALYEDCFRDTTLRPVDLVEAIAVLNEPINWWRAEDDESIPAADSVFVLDATDSCAPELSSSIRPRGR